jgi:hypothetical protein
MGQRAAATGVKFWPGSPSTLGEKVAFGLIWRFSTFDCISNNLACFEDGFGDSGSFLHVGDHCFYIVKLFPEEVTNVHDPLYDAGSSYSESSDLGAMVKVMARGDEEGGDPPRARRSNAFFHRSRLLHSQSRTPQISPSWTCEHHSTTSSTPSRSKRPWSRHASSSSARLLKLKTLGAA